MYLTQCTTCLWGSQHLAFFFHLGFVPGMRALLSLHFFSWSLWAGHRVPLTMCDPWMTCCVCEWGTWGVDGGWMPLPTHPQRYCDPASLVISLMALNTSSLSALADGWMRIKSTRGRRLGKSKLYREIFFKWGKVSRHQILVITFQDEPKLVYSCKLLDIYFLRKKKYFWQILLILLSNPKFQENQCFLWNCLYGWSWNYRILVKNYVE